MRHFSERLHNDLIVATRTAAASGTINIVSLADDIRRRNIDENVALEDIVHAVLRHAQWMNLPIEFSGADEALLA